MKNLRCWCSNPTGGKLFAINLLFTTKQYKVDNIDNFVYYGKTRMLCLSRFWAFKMNNIYGLIEGKTATRTHCSLTEYILSYSVTVN